MVGQAGRRGGQETGRLTAGVQLDPRVAGREPEDVERRLVDPWPAETAPGDPKRVVGGDRGELCEGEDFRRVELIDVPATKAGPDPPAVGELGGLRLIGGQGFCTRGDQVEADRLGEAVVGVAHAVQVPVDEPGEHPPAVEVDELRLLRVCQRPDGPAGARGDDPAITNSDGCHLGVGGVDRADLAVVQNDVRSIRPVHLRWCRAAAGEHGGRSHDDQAYYQRHGEQ